VAAAAGAGVAAFLVLSGFVYRTFQTSLSNGGSLRVQKASFWQSIHGASCKVLYTPSKGTPGRIELRQNLFNTPLILFSDSSSNGLLCLYDFDVDLRLIRFDPNIPFSAPPSSSYIAAIVLSSSWQAFDASITDWDYAARFLKGVQGRNGEAVRLFGIGLSKVLERTESQLQEMKRLGATNWPITTIIFDN